MQANYRALLKEKNYIKSTLASFITRIGDGIDMIAFSWLVYEITGSTVLMASISAVNMIPNITIGFISGVLCKYLDEKKIMWICDFGRGVCVSLIAVLYLTNHLQVWHLFVITFLNSSFEGFRSPATTSIFPKILKEENMEVGLALQESLTQVGNLIGLCIGPICIAMFNLGGAIAIDAGSFLLCGLVIMCLKDIKLTEIKEENTSLWKDFVEGFVYIKKDALLINVLLFILLINALLVPFNVFQAAYVKDYLHMGSEGISIYSVAQVIGMIVFAPMVPKLKSRLNYRWMIIIGGILCCFTFTWYGFMPAISSSLWMYLLIAINGFSVGMTLSFVNVPFRLAMMFRVEQEYLARFSAVVSGFSMGMQPLASFIFGLISNVCALDVIYISVGVITTIFFGLQIFNKVLKELEQY